jgi:hypothetical protein
MKWHLVSIAHMLFEDSHQWSAQLTFPSIRIQLTHLCAFSSFVCVEGFIFAEGFIFGECFIPSSNVEHSICKLKVI